MASINWQNLWCRFGLHVGKWGEVYKFNNHKLDGDTGKILELFYPAQNRVCTNCNAQSRREVK